MTHTLPAPRPSRRLIQLLATGTLLALSALAAQAQSTGGIKGRVFNPATKEYVANAEISVAGTDLTATTGDDGSYAIDRVPAGQETVKVEYTGYQNLTASVAVSPGQTATQNFNLLGENAAATAAAGNEPIKLEAFTVAAEREGNAKAIMEQKASMNISNVVSSDTFGNSIEGNVGDFIKYLPAIDVDYVEADPRSPRVRGLPAQYTSVTYNGMALASADGFIQNNGTDNGGGAGAGDRSFGFDAVSMANIDAVEVNYTTNASMDADAPAGNINLKPKHAYERSGQFISLQYSEMANSEELYGSKQFGPDDAMNSRLRPNASGEYSNSFFDNRLGIIISGSESDTFHEQRQFAPVYSTTPTATDLRPLVITSLNYKDGPTQTQRTLASFAVDFKATDALSLSLLGQWTGYDSWIGNRTFGVTTSSRANVPGDGLSSWEDVPISSVTSTMSYLNKRTFGHVFLPSFEYKLDNLDVNGAVSISQSINNYAGGESKSFPGNTVAGTSISTTGMTVNASHPSSDPFAWTIVQTGGLDWANLNNYHAAATADPTFSEDGRYAKNLIDQAKLDGRYTTGWSIPTWFQTGGEVTETTYDYQNPTAWQTWNYIGPGGGPGGNWALFPSSFQFNPGNGASFQSIGGGTAAVQNHNAIGQLFQADPQDFVQTTTAANYLTAFVLNPRFVKEQVDAGYAMIDSKPLPHLELQAGVRYERTEDDIKAFQSLATSQVVAAGYAVSSTTGQATTIPGIQYQYFSQPRSSVTHAYGNFFPSASLKYDFTPNLQGLLGYSNTITRPSFNNIAGVTTEDDDDDTFTVPNPDLKAQYANNYSARLSYYLEKTDGSIAIGAFENNFKNYQESQTLGAGSAATIGFTDPSFANYSVSTTINLPGTVVFRGMTLEYSQSLSYLPKALSGLTAFANFTRLYTEVQGIAPAILNAATPYNYGWLPGATPYVANYGLSWKYKRLSLGANMHWTDRQEYSGTYNVWEKPENKLSANASYALNDHLSVFFTGSNLLDVRDYVYGNNNTQQIQSSGARGIEYYGAYLYSGIKASF